MRIKEGIKEKIKEKITILLPVHNPNMYFLRKTINSVVNQKLDKKFFKLLIIRDTGDANQEKEIKKIIENRINFSILNIGKCNISEALQVGLSNVHTTYFARIDSDDIMEEDRLEKQLEFIEKDNDIAVLGTKLSLINDKSDEINSISGSLCYPSNKLLFLFIGSFYNNPVAHPSVLCRTKDIKDFGGYRIKPPAEDYWLWSKLILNKKIVNMKTPLTKYRIHSGQLSEKKRLNYKNRIFIRIRFWKALFKNKGSGTFLAIIFSPALFIPLFLSQKIFRLISKLRRFFPRKIIEYIMHEI